MTVGMAVLMRLADDDDADDEDDSSMDRLAIPPALDPELEGGCAGASDAGMLEGGCCFFLIMSL